MTMGLSITTALTLVLLLFMFGVGRSAAGSRASQEARVNEATRKLAAIRAQVTTLNLTSTIDWTRAFEQLMSLSSTEVARYQLPQKVSLRLLSRQASAIGEAMDERWLQLVPQGEPSLQHTVVVP